MAESIVTKRTILVMDGSNEKIVGNIIELVDHIAKELSVKAICRDLDGGHPTIKIIETAMDEERFVVTQDLIERRYPGLCVFDPPME